MHPISRGRMMIMVTMTVAVTLGSARAAGQSAAPNTDVLSSLLTEVRGLRAAMEQMAAAGPRVQLAMGRLQLQEQRLNTMLRRLDDLREQLSSRDAEIARRREQLKHMQDAAQTASDPNERRGAEEAVRDVSASLAMQAREVQRLRAEETELSNSVAAEQARWADLNQRLDDLERALAKRN